MIFEERRLALFSGHFGFAMEASPRADDVVFVFVRTLFSVFLPTFLGVLSTITHVYKRLSEFFFSPRVALAELYPVKKRRTLRDEI